MWIRRGQVGYESRYMNPSACKLPVREQGSLHMVHASRWRQIILCSARSYATGWCQDQGHRVRCPWFTPEGENRSFRELCVTGNGPTWPRVLPPGSFGFYRSRDRFAITLGMGGLPQIQPSDKNRILFREP